jgi:hypothetical protein
MSGIMAIVSLDGRPTGPGISCAQLAAATRGESGPGVWERDDVVVGHANLPRTLEAEQESLPDSNERGRFWLTSDGSLDNRDELAGVTCASYALTYAARMVQTGPFVGSPTVAHNEFPAVREAMLREVAGLASE